MKNQTIKNDPADRSDKAKIELFKRLCSLWWSYRDSNPGPLQCECSALSQLSYSPSVSRHGRHGGTDILCLARVAASMLGLRTVVWQRKAGVDAVRVHPGFNGWGTKAPLLD